MKQLEELVNEVIAEYPSIGVTTKPKANLILEVYPYCGKGEGPTLILDGSDYLTDPTHDRVRNLIRQHMNNWLASSGD